MLFHLGVRYLGPANGVEQMDDPDVVDSVNKKAVAGMTSRPPIKLTAQNGKSGAARMLHLFFYGLALLAGAGCVARRDWTTAYFPQFSLLYDAALAMFLLWSYRGILINVRFNTACLIVWVTLLIGFALFCNLFDLHIDYIFSKAGMLIGYETRDGFLQGALLTLMICVFSIVFAMLIAMATALAKLFGGGGLYGLSTFYISVFRGTPLLLQVLIIYLGLPQIGWTISAIPAGIIALSLNYGAYMAEIFRSGIQAIARGQWEAAAALGLHRWRCLRLIIIPQALRLIIPATGNQFIMMLKDSSLVSVMGVWELMYVARAIGRADFRYMEMLISAAIIYWVLSGALEFLQGRMEARYGREHLR